MNEKIHELIKQLTLEEKAALCSGISSWETTPISRLGIPSVFMADGPHGVRREVVKEGLGNIFKESIPATCFPPAVTLASTWDKDILRQIGEALADECLEQKVSTILGPGINIKRNPMCGRNFEYFSEDPYLAGELAAAYVNGVQSKGVGTSLKHYAVNSQEYKRLVASSEVDERALREIYLAAFEKVVKEAQPYTVMCSYNPVNGVHASDNKKLLTDILRTEWGYKGIVVSDWGAVNDRVKGIKAGLDLEMPSSNGENDRFIIDAVKAGKLDEKDLDVSVERILQYVLRCYETLTKNEYHAANFEKNHRLARKAAAEGSVLLKNTGNILPLEKNKSFAVIGQMAKKIRSQGSGSSQLNPKNLVSFTDALDKEGIGYEYADGYDIENAKPVTSMIFDACKKAQGKDYVILFIGLTENYESEGFDREHIDIPPSHIALLEELYKYNKNIVAVLTGGSPVAMPWLDKVSALLNVYLGGEAGGEATLDVLLGAVNPSGKLAETYPISVNDVMSNLYFCKDPVEYRESVYVGYRYFDSAKKPVLFPFGFGLSYTKFEYSDLKLSAERIKAGENLSVTLTVKNTGSTDGAEVVQIYVRDIESTLFRPEKELKAFEKIFLKAGESKEISLTLDERAFQFYNTVLNGWTAEAGEFEILAASSSKDIRLSKKVTLDAPQLEIADYRVTAPVYYNMEKAAEIPLDQFEALLGRRVTEYVKKKKGSYDMNTTVGELDSGWFARLFRFIILKGSSLALPRGSSKVMKKMALMGAMSLPVRNIYMMTAGAISYEAVLGLLQAFNGKFLKGITAMLKALKHKPTPKKELYK